MEIGYNRWLEKIFFKKRVGVYIYPNHFKSWLLAAPKPRGWSIVNGFIFKLILTHLR